MKKSLIILIMATVVLAALTGCQREVVSQENGKGVKEVNTQFVFNIANSSAQTKQAASAVQEGDSPKFRGIVDARLMSYTLSNDGQILKADASPSRLYNLSQLVPADNGPRRVIEMSLVISLRRIITDIWMIIRYQKRWARVISNLGRGFRIQMAFTPWRRFLPAS